MNRILWHLFGAAATALFMIGLLSCGEALKHSDWSQLPPWAWAIMALFGFVGIMRYTRWYRH